MPCVSLQVWPRLPKLIFFFLASLAPSREAGTLPCTPEPVFLLWQLVADDHPHFDCLPCFYHISRGSTFPRDSLGNGYCVAGPQGQTLFRLHPERAMYYRADIALLTHLHPFRAVVTPANPQPDDVCVRGWVCRAVVAATDRDDQVAWDGSVQSAIVGLLDCRPLFLGWLPVTSASDWLDLEPIRAALMQSVPDGQQVVFPGMPPHWTWTCFVPGQVIQVSLEPSDEHMQPGETADVHMGSDTGPGPDGSTPHDNKDGSDLDEASPNDPSPRGQLEHPNPWRRPLIASLLLGLGIALLSACLSSGNSPFLFLLVGFRRRDYLVLLCLASIACEMPIANSAQLPRSTLPHFSVDAPASSDTPCSALMADSTYAGLGTRPLPTPCRRRSVLEGHVPALAGHECDLDFTGLCTLLQDSAKRSQHWAFTAATLLDALEEHFMEQGSASDLSSSEPVLLRLSDHVDHVRHHDLTGFSFPCGSLLADAAKLVQVSSWPLRVDLPSRARQTACHGEWLDLSGVSEWPSLIHVFTDGSYNEHSSSWAFVVLAPGSPTARFLGWQAGPTITDTEHACYLGATRHHALIGEQCALLWAVFWALQTPPHCCVHFFADCEVALRQTTGRYGTSAPGSLAAKCRAAFQALLSARPHLASDITHVRSQRGTPANELADQLAKWACQIEASALPDGHMATVASWCRSHSLDWLWMAFESIRTPDCWPTFGGACFVDGHASPTPPLLTPTECHELFGLTAPTPVKDSCPSLAVSLCLFSLNTQTLAEPEHDPESSQRTDSGFLGRAAFLREQFDYYGAHVVALQEARAATDATFVSKTHLRLCTGRDKQGNFGVELWFSLRHSFARIGTTEIRFEPAHLLVLHSSPRDIFVRYCRGSLRILFVSAHAPVATCPTRESWWRDFKARVERLRRDSQLVVLGDLNAHFADSLGWHVGDLVFPTKHALPTALAALLQSERLWIPSTFSACHPGPVETWWPPGGGPGARLDYALLPASWQVEEGGSAVFTALDWGQQRVDHQALRTWAACHGTFPRTSFRKRPAFDRSAMLTDEGRASLSDIFANVPAQPWELDVHRHYLRVQQYLVGALSTTFPPVQGKCHSSHFSAQTWQLRQRRIWLRRRITHLGGRLSRLSILGAFRAWVLDLRLVVAEVAVVLKQGRDIQNLAGHIADLRSTRRTLRQAIRADVAARITATANEATSLGTGQVVSRLHCLAGPPARRARSNKGLPGITLEDGSPAQDPKELEQAWVKHFSSIEAGRPRDPTQLVAECLQAQSTRDPDQYCPEIGEIPTRLDLEKAFRDTVLHRAFGLDGIPAEALHAAPSAASLALFPVILKCSMRIQEPLQFKGGSLYAVWKGKSAPSHCSAYRGILVSSTVGKAYHSILRTRNIPALSAVASPLQIGGLPRRPVTLAAHVVRLHQSWCASHQRSQAVLFLDLREAFYRIVRPAVVGFSGTEDDIAAILRAVSLPAGVTHGLRQHLQEHSMFIQAGASPWLSAVTGEALQHTWFRFEQGEMLTETGIGTRPGDNLADLIFSYVFSQVLHQVRRTVDDKIGLSTLPWHPDMMNQIFEVSVAPVENIPLLDCTWMDDAALVVNGKSPTDLIERLGHIAGALLDGCLGRALLPNLDRGKTEAVVSLTGPGSRKARACLFRDDPATIAAQSEHWPSAHIKVVPLYKHLGGHIHHTGALIRELKHRVAMAWVAFTKRRKKVFASAYVSLKDKAILFDSLVLSVLLYGAGTWRELTTVESQCLTTAYHQMAFAMLRPLYDSDAARRLGGPRALMLLGLPALDTLLHLARLRHVQSCVIVESREFWALAHSENRWLLTVRASLGWFQVIMGEDDPTGDPREQWTRYVHTMRQRPGTWKSLLRQAQTRALRREAWEASLTSHRGLLARQLRMIGGLLIESPPAEWDQRYCCGPCKRTFASRQQWSVHAFKTHGRCAMGRGILPGRQCQSCLRHFGTNLKLCKHLAYSSDCRHKLQHGGFTCAPGPGQGNTRAEDAAAVQAPVLQAQGPLWPLQPAYGLDEEERPVAEVLDCMALIDFDGEVGADSLWSRVHTAFSCVCASTSRLRFTAELLLRQARAGSVFSHDTRSAILPILEWIVSADIVEWLVPSPDHVESSLGSFKDRELVLSLLEVSDIPFPAPEGVPASPVYFLVGPSRWSKELDSVYPNCLVFDWEECIDTIREGRSLSLFDGPFEDAAFVICLQEWSGFGHPPPSNTKARTHQRLLTSETLGGDLLRFTIRLWTLGVPAMLLFPPSILSAVSPLPEIRCLESGERAGLRFLRTQGHPW